MWSNWPLYLALIVSAARYARGIDRVPTLNTRHAQLSIRPCMHCAARTVHQECMCSLLCLVKSASEKYVNKVNRTKKKKREKTRPHCITAKRNSLIRSVCEATNMNYRQRGTRDGGGGDGGNSGIEWYIQKHGIRVLYRFDDGDDRRRAIKLQWHWKNALHLLSSVAATAVNDERRSRRYVCFACRQHIEPIMSSQSNAGARTFRMFN